MLQRSRAAAVTPAQAGGHVVIASKRRGTTPNSDSRKSSEPAASVDVKAIPRVSHCPKALGAPVGAMADMARGERAGTDRVARTEVLTRLGARHVG